ncbi:hypothetical protein FACS189499_03180 [Clostridia bacterium]|nr:hypothetical protein FACS189499_03180 [Clostridia bacterium]
MLTKPKFRTTPPVPRNRRRISGYLLAAAAGLVVSGAVVVFFSAVIFLLQIPEALSSVFGIIAFGTGCLFAGIFAGRVKRRNGLPTGTAAALLMLVPVLILSVMTGNFSGEAVTGRIVTAILCGAVGGVIGVNKNPFR